MDGGQIVFANLDLELKGVPVFLDVGRSFEEAAIIVVVGCGVLAAGAGLLGLGFVLGRRGAPGTQSGTTTIG